MEVEKMAIEGLSGVRGIQTQSVAAPKPVTTGKQEVPVFRTSQAAATYDKAANAVDTAVEKDNAASKTEQGQETADKGGRLTLAPRLNRGERWPPLIRHARRKTPGWT